DEYINLNNVVFEDSLKVRTEDIIKLFSFRKHNNSQFDRFQLKYNVWEKPFVRIGNLLFSPTMFFANNDWCYSFTERALRLSIESRSKVMEKYLYEKFVENRFKAKNISDNETNEIQGDVDLFVEDDETLIFIQ